MLCFTATQSEIKNRNKHRNNNIIIINNNNNNNKVTYKYLVKHTLDKSLYINLRVQQLNPPKQYIKENSLDNQTREIIWISHIKMNMGKDTHKATSKIRPMATCFYLKINRHLDYYTKI